MTIPPATLTLEEEEVRFYAAIGKALTQWQSIETGLANIFCAIVGRPGDSGLANIAFYSVENFRAKLAMTNNVATARFSFVPARNSEWCSLHKSAVARSKKRNFLAHYQLEIETHRNPGERCRLRPSPNNMLADDRSDYDPPTYSTQNIVEFGNSFDALGSQLMTFWEAIRPPLRTLPP
jgi:hypothetical protein